MTKSPKIKYDEREALIFAICNDYSIFVYDIVGEQEFSTLSKEGELPHIKEQLIAEHLNVC